MPLSLWLIYSFQLPICRLSRLATRSFSTTSTLISCRCDGKRVCNIPVQSSQFPDACPGTSKYLEIHYACRSASGTASGHSGKKLIPPWLQKANRVPDNKRIWTKSKKPIQVNSRTDGSSSTGSTTSTTPRKPILVTENFANEDEEEEEDNDVPRVPITTPRPTTRRTTTTATPTTANTRRSQGRKNSVRIVTPTTGTVNMAKSSLITSSSIPPYKNPNTWCSPKTSRQLQWDWTEVGREAVQPCPIGATGHARWACVASSSASHWATPSPDMSNCKSVAMTNLEAQVRKEDPENVLISALAYLTRTKSLYGGDLETAVTTMRTVASRIQYRLQHGRSSFHNKESHIRQVLQNVLRSASNILEMSNRQAWDDLSRESRMKVATELLLALDENAFLLAGVMNEPDVFLESSEILSKLISANAVVLSV